jgi:solute carrier family 25 protein 39/40
MQVNRNLSSNKQISSLQFIIKNNGIKGFWRGLSPTLLMQVPGTGLYYSIYEQLRYTLNNNFSEETRIYSPLIAGCLGRICATFATSPFELVRTAAQANLSDGNSKLQKNTLSNIIQMIRTKQVSPWTGLGITLLRDAPFSAVYWFSYEYLKQRLIAKHGNENLFVYAFMSGALSGMVAALLTNPLDVVKSTIQSDPAKQRRIWPTVQQLYAEDGLKSFTRGWIPRTARVAPGCAIMICTYEVFKHYYSKHMLVDR